MRRVVVLMGVVAVTMAAGQLAAADGKAVYDKSCAACHAAMQPKLGDKKAWAPLLKRGAKELTASVIKGKGAMPPKGGVASDADVSAAVDYMISMVK